PSIRRYEIYQPAGFTGLRISAPVFERLTEEQIFLLEQEEQAGRAELDRLVERLRIRLGEGGLVGVAGVECYVPERAYRTDGTYATYRTYKSHPSYQSHESGPTHRP